MLKARILLSAVFLALVGTPLVGQTIRGRVVDAVSGEPIPVATVTAIGPDERTAGQVRTGQDGSFVLQLRNPGAYRLREVRTGYSASLSKVVEVKPRETLDVELRLSTEPLRVETLTVTARMEPPRVPELERNGFYNRERIGSGHHLRHEDIERQSNRNLAQVLDRIPGTQVYRDKNGREYLYFSRSQTNGALSPARGRTNICLPNVHLDGTSVAYAVDGPTINDFVQPEQIEAVEAYRSASEIPVEYNSNAACGVILVWTRARK